MPYATRPFVTVKNFSFFPIPLPLACPGVPLQPVRKLLLKLPVSRAMEEEQSVRDSAQLLEAASDFAFYAGNLLA